jgi:hypothetical protein
MALNINGTTGISGVDASVSAPALTGTDSNTGISFPSADTIKFSTGGVERMAITNSGITGITQGLTEVDSWRLNSNFSAPGGSGGYITANWERDDSNFEKIGTGLTESSGVFTFPSTGKYLIDSFFSFQHSQTSQYVGLHLAVSINGGSSFANRTLMYQGVYAANAYGAYSQRKILDVTDISNFQFKFGRTVHYDTATINGASDANRSGFICIKLGET